MAKDEAAERVSIEFLVEPFVGGDPGNHVAAAINAFTTRDLDVELGAFSSTASGQIDEIGPAVNAMLIEAMNAGATAIHLQVASETGHLASPTLHGALDSMMRAAEREVGAEPENWTRQDKQRVVRMLDERGAFLLRGAVDDIADAMGVSRITIYNYLHAIEETSE